MCCQLQRQTALVNAQSELAQLFIKFPLEWFLAGNELRSEPVLFVRRSNFWHFCSSRGFWSYPNVLNMVYCLIQSWKKALCFPACWCIRLWACTLFDVHSMNNSFCFLRTKTFPGANTEISQTSSASNLTEDTALFTRGGGLYISTWLRMPTWRRPGSD